MGGVDGGGTADRSRSSEFVRQVHRMRTLGLGLGFLCVAAVFLERGAPTVLWVLLGVNGFLWPHGAYLIARRAADPRRAEHRSLLVDSAMGGVWIALMALNALPSALFITMLAIDKISAGGWPLLRRALLLQAVAGFLTSAAAGFPFAPATSMTVVLASLPFLVGYSVALSATMYGLSRRVLRQNAELEERYSEEAALREELARARNLEAVGRLAGGVAHGFNNFLTVILGNADLLRRTAERDAVARERLSDLTRAAERAAELTRQLLAFGRRTVLRPEVVDPEEVVADLAASLRRLLGKRYDLVVEPAERPVRVSADRAQVEEVLVDLALNARDAMPEGGRLTIALTEVRLGEALATPGDAVPPGRWVVLEVRDAGKGMDDETQARLFEPFFTTKGIGKGTGLGLATVYGIVKQSGGHIAVESAVGRGTRFRIFFPPAAAPAPGGDLAPAAAGPLSLT